MLWRLTSEIALRPPNCPSIVSQSKATPASCPSVASRTAAASSVSACAPRPNQQSLGQVFLQSPCRQATPPRRNAKLVSQDCLHQLARLAERSESVRVAISLSLSHFRVAISRQHLGQQQHAPSTVSTANTSTRTTHLTTSNRTSSASLTVATWSARVSKWLAPTFGIKDATLHAPSHSNIRQQLFNRSQMRPFLQSLLCPHVSVVPVPESA